MRFWVSLCLASAASLSCKSEAGESVGAWEILKFPQSTSYVYSTEASPSLFDLNSTTDGALAYTMQQLWSHPSHAIYNDEPPYATTYNFSAAHAKAIFMWDSTSAVALFHSIPKFPVGPQDSPEYIGLLPNAWEYAQHIVCLTTTPTALQVLLPVLAGMNPNLYDGTLPTARALPTDQCSYTVLQDRVLITKSADYEVDIWSTCVGPYFSTTLQVISWVHGQTEGPACNVTATLDITDIAYSFGTSYTNYDNHAKWGIGIFPLVCFGDLNRVVTQKVRSGAVLCWKDTSMYSALHAIVAETDNCP